MLSVLLAVVAGCTGHSISRDPRWLFDREEPVVKRGDTFLAIAGGGCLGRCPDFEIYMFDSGRLVFLGREFTQVRGLVESRIDSGRFQELAKALRDADAFAWHPRLTCRTDHPKFTVFSSRGGSIRGASLDSGCDNQAKVLEKVVEAFVAISGTANLISAAPPGVPANP
jgi:hypothetical protein